MSNGRVRELKGQIAELKSRWPAHSVPPTMLQQFEELEEELELELRKAAEDKINLEEEKEMGSIVAVCTSQRSTDPKRDVGEGYLRQGYGLVGDAHAGLSEREVSLLAWESIERINREHGIEAGPGDFAENLTTQGIDLLSLPIGARLRTGEVVLEVVQIGKPPHVAHTYSFQGLSLLPTEGIFCRVVKGGWVRRGDQIVVLEADQTSEVCQTSEV